MSNAIQRLRNDLSRLRKAHRERNKHKHELHRDQRELKHDKKALNKDKRELVHDRKALNKSQSVIKQERRELTEDRALLAQHQTSKADRVAALEARRGVLEQQYQDSFDPGDPASTGDPAIKAELDAVTQREATVAAAFDQKIADDQKAIAQSTRVIGRRQERVADLREELQGDRKEVKSDRRELKRDHKQLRRDHKHLRHDHDRIHDIRQRALNHLRPAEYQMGLKATNRVRKALGLKPVDHVIRPINLNTVRGCAQFLLRSNNVSFWSGLSTGSDRKNLELLARGKPAFVPATGGHVWPKLSMMKALVDMAKHGRIMINALTGGIHSSNSNHYRGTAVDLDVSTGNAGMIESIARKYGGLRNFETSHIHLDF